MSVALPQTRMTADEFVQWCSRQGEGRYELVGGEVVMMSPEKLRHVRVKSRAWGALARAIDLAGIPCEAVADGIAVRIDEFTVREPDVSVQCHTGDPDSVFLDEPVILVEVLSPSSERSDTGAKLAEYFRIASVRHYVILDPERRIAIHHARATGTDEISTRIVSDGALSFAPPGFTVQLADLFGEVDR